jgi:serine O-acetyltransferase
MLQFDWFKILIYSWTVLALCMVCAWFSLFASALFAAKSRAYRGHWWGKYVLGLHLIFSAVYQGIGSQFLLPRQLIAFIYQCLTLPFGIELPLGVKIGNGLTMSHTSGIVIHSGTVIGENCTFHSGVVLGAKGRQDPPIIGNNVYIGANTVIAGPIRVGNNATIGACALVTRDVPDNALISCRQAEIIKTKYTRRYSNWDLDTL